MSFGTDDGFFPDTRPARPRRPPTADDLAATIALSVLLLVVGCGLSFFVLLEQSGVAGCSADASACDYALLSATTWITPAATIASLALAIVALARRPRTRRRTWWLPALGLVITGVAFTIASMLVAEALSSRY